MSLGTISLWMADTQRSEDDSNEKMKRILITGATGLLGSSVCARAAKDFEIYGIARTSRAFPRDCVPFRFDLTDRGKTTQCLEDTHPDVILHCVAITDVDRCEAEPAAARDLHVKVSRMLASWAGTADCLFVYISTDSVFDGRAGNYNELDLPSPLNEYARTKLEGEIEVLEANPSALILRTNFYGWGSTRKNLVTWILNRLESRQKVKAFVDVYFNPLPAGIVAEIILELIERNACGTFHLGAMDCFSKYEFAQQIADIFDFPVAAVIPASVDKCHFKAQRPKNTTLDVSKLSAFLNREMPLVQDALQEFRKQVEREGGASPIIKSAELIESAVRK